MCGNHTHQIRFQYIVYLKLNKWRGKIYNVGNKNSIWCVKQLENKKCQLCILCFQLGKMPKGSLENWLYINELILLTVEDKMKYNIQHNFYSTCTLVANTWEKLIWKQKSNNFFIMWQNNECSERKTVRVRQKENKNKRMFQNQSYYVKLVATWCTWSQKICCSAGRTESFHQKVTLLMQPLCRYKQVFVLTVVVL